MFSTPSLSWLAVLGVLAGSLGLPPGATAPARADKLAELKKIDRELDHLIAAKKKHHHKKKNHHRTKSMTQHPTSHKHHHHKRHHHRKKTASVRALEEQLDRLLDRDLGKKG
jgi:hypothetical protein